MAKQVLGPVKAEFTYCPSDSKIKYAENNVGLLYVGFSKTGKYFAKMVFDHPWGHIKDDNFLYFGQPYIETSKCDLVVEDNKLMFYRDKGDKFIFTILDDIEINI